MRGLVLKKEEKRTNVKWEPSPRTQATPPPPATQKKHTYLYPTQESEEYVGDRVDVLRHPQARVMMGRRARLRGWGKFMPDRNKLAGRGTRGSGEGPREHAIQVSRAGCAKESGGDIVGLRNALREDSFSLNAGRMMLLNRSPEIDSSAFRVSRASSTAKPNPTPIGATQSEATSGQTLTPVHQYLPNPHSPLRSVTYTQRPPTLHYSLVPHEALDRGLRLLMRAPWVR